jgi:elongation factor Ts
MAEITAEAVRTVRDRTDLPMMDCKRALVESNGDIEKAIEILKLKAKNVVDKTKDRATSEGRVLTLTAADGSAAVMIELQCESAPVAKSDDFSFLADQIARQFLNGPGAASPEELMTQLCPDRAGTTLAALREEAINKIRENMVLRRILKVTGPVGGYSHHNGSLGVLLQVSGSNATAEVIRDVSMHIAALSPTVTLPSELDPALVVAEKEKLTAEAKASGKPDNVIEKIVTGRLKTFFQNNGVLVEQVFAKDETKSVAQALAAAGLTAVGFTRWRLGQA